VTATDGPPPLLKGNEGDLPSKCNRLDAITPETALQLERVLGVPARFWNNLENTYRETVSINAEEVESTA
jgi:plasmid maintenance system antidote protein VapI